MRRTWLIVLLIVLAAVLAYTLRGLVAETVIAPILYLAYLVRLAVAVIPEVAWWGLFVLVALELARRSLFRRRARLPKSSRLIDEPASRAETWRRWIDQQSKGQYFQARLARQAAELGLDILAQREGIERAELLARLQAGGAGSSSLADLPEEIRSYLLAATARASFSGLESPPALVSGKPLSLAARINAGLASLRRRLVYRAEGGASMNADLERVVEYFEKLR